MLRLTLPRGLDRLERRAVAPYDIIFADPPYGFDQPDDLLPAIDASRLLGKGGIVIVEHFAGHVPRAPEGLERTREERYGQTGLSFFA
mgnify:CR=1 FL=1